MHHFLWLLIHMEMCPAVNMHLYSIIENSNVKNSTTVYCQLASINLSIETQNMTECVPWYVSVRHISSSLYAVFVTFSIIAVCCECILRIMCCAQLIFNVLIDVPHSQTPFKDCCLICLHHNIRYKMPRPMLTKYVWFTVSKSIYCLFCSGVL